MSPSIALPSDHIGHILIIGGGVGGLALAQGLLQYGVSFTVFERDDAPNSRTQGYRIKAFPDTIGHLRELLPRKVFSLFEETCAETNMRETNLNAVDGSVMARRMNRGPKPYTVDRGVWRTVMFHGLEEHISWGKVFTHYETDDEGVVAHFADGTSARGSLLVGADGGRSLVRKQFLPDACHYDTGGVCIYGKTFLTPELRVTLNPRLMGGLVICQDTTPMVQKIIFGDLSISCMVEAIHFPNRTTRFDLPEDYMYWGMTLLSKALGPTPEVQQKMLHLPAADLALLLSEEWDPSIRCLIENQDKRQTASMRIISASSDIAEWQPDARVTLLGDAVHLMSPTGGVGAVTAVKDAAVILQTLLAKGLSAEAIGSYERVMRQHAGASIARSEAGGRAFFGQAPLLECRKVMDW